MGVAPQTPDPDRLPGHVMRRLELIGLPGLPLVAPGDDLGAIIRDGLAAAGLGAGPGDVVVVAQKVVSKAEGRYVDLARVEPSAAAERLAREVEKDARLIDVILSESDSVVRQRTGLVVVRHRLGFVMANAGVDASNIRVEGMAEPVLLLPVDPDASAAALRRTLADDDGEGPAVIVNDSVGRAWRHGTVGIALGSAGLTALWDRRGEPDLFGRTLRVTMVALADEIAAAASLVQGQADEATPVVLVRGVDPAALAADTGQSGRDLVRPEVEDLFR